MAREILGELHEVCRSAPNQYAGLFRNRDASAREFCGRSFCRPVEHGFFTSTLIAFLIGALDDDRSGTRHRGWTRALAAAGSLAPFSFTSTTNSVSIMGATKETAETVRLRTLDQQPSQGLPVGTLLAPKVAAPPSGLFEGYPSFWSAPTKTGWKLWPISAVSRV
jgi:hypothetical protein